MTASDSASPIPLEQPGDPFGAHRVTAPRGCLPQAAEKVDNDFSRFYDTELLLDVNMLNLDAASFRQLREAASDDPERIGQLVLETVHTRGKQHNPVTGSGGMLLGTVRRVGSAAAGQVPEGARVASLVSLTLTPLSLSAIERVHLASGQLDVSGQAVLFVSSPLAVLPEDLPERVALAALDVCGAPAQVARSARSGQTVLVLGAGGKSGLLCVAQAREQVGEGGRVLGVELDAGYREALGRLGLCDAVIEADARDPLALRAAVLTANAGKECDLVVSCVNVDGAELGAVLCARDRGEVYYFAMTTSFSRAALGAEGVGKDVDLRIGNGFVHGHAALTLDLLRRHRAVRELFEQRYAALAER